LLESVGEPVEELNSTRAVRQGDTVRVERERVRHSRVGIGGATLEDGRQCSGAACALPHVRGRGAALVARDTVIDVGRSAYRRLFV